MEVESKQIKTFTYIEVENLEHCWAIFLDDCKKEMNPIVPSFVLVCNDISNKNVIIIDNTLMDTKPEKIINGVNGGIADWYKELGFWKIKK